MKKKLLFLCMCVLFAATTFSQVNNIGGYLNFSPTIPMGAYQDNISRPAWGGRAGVFIQPYKRVPLKIGIEGGYVTQGFKTQYYNSIGFSQFSDYRVRARLNIFSALINLRLQEKPGKKLMYPLIEIQAGWNNFYGTNKLQGRNPSENYSWQKIDRTSTRGYWGFTYGGTVGVDISLNRKEQDVFIECKIAYLKGNKTKYYTNPSVDAGGNASFTLNESETDMLIPQIGLKFGF
jgi:hypothetical protein